MYGDEYVADHLWCRWSLPASFSHGEYVVMDALIDKYPDGSGRIGIMDFKSVHRRWWMLKF